MIFTLWASLALLVLCGTLYGLSRTRVRLLSGFYSPLGLSLCIFFFLIACLVQGLVRQSPGSFDADWASRAGLRSFKDSIFMLSTLLLLLVCTGMRAMDNFSRKGRWRQGALAAGIFLSLLSLLMGSYALERYPIALWKGMPQWRTEIPGSPGKVKEFPFAMQLEDFQIDYHEPTLYVVDTRTGLPLPEKRPQGLKVDPGRVQDYKQGKGPAQEKEICQWRIRVLDYLPKAWIREQGLSYECFASDEEGWSVAVKVETLSLKDSSRRQEWICSGSILQIPLFIRFDSVTALGMGKPQAKDYRATLKLLLMENGGHARMAEVSPNHPAKAGAYRIYLKSYKESHGFWDPYVRFELVKDPWEPVSFAGLALVLASLIALALKKRPRSHPLR